MKARNLTVNTERYTLWGEHTPAASMIHNFNFGKKLSAWNRVEVSHALAHPGARKDRFHRA